MLTWTPTQTWTAVLGFIFSNALTSALQCDWLRHYNHRNNKCLNLLENMGGQLIEEDRRVLFPYGLYRRIRNEEVESQLVFIRDSLEYIFDLYYHGNRSSVTWDTVKTENFLESLHSQIEKLNGCVSINNRTNYSLRKYYKRLSKIVLDSTGSSGESWELIRRITSEHLVQLQILANSIKAQQRAPYANGEANTREGHSWTTATIIKERPTPEEGPLGP